MRDNQKITLICILVLAIASQNARAQTGPHQWLSRIADAIEMQSYQGTVVRVSDGQAELMRVVHDYRDGVAREKLHGLNGKGREIIRINGEQHCIFPDRRAVLILADKDGSGVFASLPESFGKIHNSYNLAMHENQIVAGRNTVLIILRPRDAFRYGHRLWLDSETALPLKTQVLNKRGTVVEEVSFSEIEIGGEIPASAFEPTIDTSEFTELRAKANDAAETREPSRAGWVLTETPRGFARRSLRTSRIPGVSMTVEQYVYTDGLAIVSVFVEPEEQAEIKAQGPAKIGGAANAYSTRRDGRQVTAVGEVPEMTVRKFALSMRPAGER